MPTADMAEASLRLHVVLKQSHACWAQLRGQRATAAAAVLRELRGAAPAPLLAGVGAALGATRHDLCVVRATSSTPRSGPACVMLHAYDPEVIALHKATGAARFDRTDKTWSVPLGVMPRHASSLARRFRYLIDDRTLIVRQSRVAAPPPERRAFDLLPFHVELTAGDVVVAVEAELEHISVRDGPRFHDGTRFVPFSTTKPFVTRYPFLVLRLHARTGTVYAAFSTLARKLEVVTASPAAVRRVIGRFRDTYAEARVPVVEGRDGALPATLSARRDAVAPLRSLDRVMAAVAHALPDARLALVASSHAGCFHDLGPHGDGAWLASVLTTGPHLPGVAAFFDPDVPMNARVIVVSRWYAAEFDPERDHAAGVATVLHELAHHLVAEGGLCCSACPEPTHGVVFHLYLGLLRRLVPGGGRVGSSYTIYARAHLPEVAAKTMGRIIDGAVGRASLAGVGELAALHQVVATMLAGMDDPLAAMRT